MESQLKTYPLWPVSLMCSRNFVVVGCRIPLDMLVENITYLSSKVKDVAATVWFPYYSSAESVSVVFMLFYTIFGYFKSSVSSHPLRKLSMQC
jgi:hypothetical protein